MGECDNVGVVNWRIKGEGRQFLKAAEIAEQMGLTQETVRSYISRGDLAAVRVSQRLYLVPLEAFKAFLAEREVRAKETACAVAQPKHRAANEEVTL